MLKVDFKVNMQVYIVKSIYYYVLYFIEIIIIISLYDI